VELIPSWIANLNAVMPKGEVIPLPLMVTVTFGAPVALAAREDRGAFLNRAAAELLALAPDAVRQGGAMGAGGAVAR